MGTSRGKIAMKMMESIKDRLWISDGDLRNLIAMDGGGNPKVVSEYLKMMDGFGWIKIMDGCKWEILYGK